MINKTIKLDYLESLSASDLAFWLIQSFSPSRYRDRDDVIEEAIKIMRVKSNTHIADEFVERLWGMFGLEPDKSNVISMKEYRNGS